MERTETHLVSEDSVDTVLVEGNHPIEAAHLVVPHFAKLDVKWCNVKHSYRAALGRAFL